MNTFGSFAIATPLPATPPATLVPTGMGWEYIQVVNLSPYLLLLNFEGQGQLTFPDWYREDIPVNRLFEGRLFFTPQIYTANQASSQSNLVLVNAYAQGELRSPQSVGLPRLVNPSSRVGVGLFKQVTFTGTQLNKTLTLPNQAGSTLILDGWDITGSSQTNNPTMTVTVNAIVTGLNYYYFFSASTSVLGTVDHVIYPGYGLPQATGTDITLVCSLTQGVGTQNVAVSAHYHYEANY